MKLSVKPVVFHIHTRRRGLPVLTSCRPRCNLIDISDCFESASQQQSQHTWISCVSACELPSFIDFSSTSAVCSGCFGLACRYESSRHLWLSFEKIATFSTLDVCHRIRFAVLQTRVGMVYKRNIGLCDAHPPLDISSVRPTEDFLQHAQRLYQGKAEREAEEGATHR
ncbi:hypothetical protein K474DRAFT_640601 [Panus rudis PR-1116 ss-1]|nr:hypothetical protein K474DRAFT_640601 [Panus rudis PR-1116 ss-1]